MGTIGVESKDIEGKYDSYTFILVRVKAVNYRGKEFLLLFVFRSDRPTSNNCMIIELINYFVLFQRLQLRLFKTEYWSHASYKSLGWRKGQLNPWSFRHEASYWRAFNFGSLGVKSVGRTRKQVSYSQARVEQKRACPTISLRLNSESQSHISRQQKHRVCLTVWSNHSDRK